MILKSYHKSLRYRHPRAQRGWQRLWRSRTSSSDGTENGYDLGEQHRLRACSKATIAIKRLETARNNTRFGGEHVLLNTIEYKENK